MLELKCSVGMRTKQYQQTLNKHCWETNQFRYQTQERQDVIKLPLSPAGKARSKILTNFLKLCFFTFTVRHHQFGGVLQCHSLLVNEALFSGRISISLCHQKIRSACEQFQAGQLKLPCRKIMRNLQIT